jgi:transglutaminase superfamily protein
MDPTNPETSPAYSTEVDPAVPRQLFAPSTDPYYSELRAWFELDGRIAKARTELEKARAICASVHGRWTHSNDDEPSREDPITILKEASKGRRFRCVQFAATLSGALAAFGIPARVVSLITADVETRPGGAGHVVCEMWLAALGKWAMIDAQENALVTRKGVPLNCAEIAMHLGGPDLAVDIPNFAPGADPRIYLAGNAFGPNFFYFQTRVDQRPLPPGADAPSIMLMPKGAPEPKSFQGKYPFRNVTFTLSAPSFYHPPDLSG